MNEDNRHSPLGAEMIAGLSEFADALEAGEAIEERFTVRSVTLDLEPKAYSAEDVRHLRKNVLHASQPILAKFLGVSVKALRSWEQGTRPVPTIARRYLDDIVAYPEIWRERLSSGSSKVRGKPIKN